MAKSLDAQTRQSSIIPAFLASVPIFLVAIGLETWILFFLIPIEGWTPSQDRPVTLDLVLLKIMFNYANVNVTRPASIGDYFIFLPYWLKLFFSSFLYYQVLLPSIIRSGACLWVGWKCSNFVYSKIFRKTLALPSVVHVKGPEPLYGGAGISHLNEHWSDRREAEEQGGLTGIQIAPGVVMPTAIETEHILLCGRSGGGKSVILEYLAWQAIARGDRVLMLDVKGGLNRRIRRRFKHIKPHMLGIAGSSLEGWNVGVDITNRADAAELAAILIKETRDPIWSDGSRLILVAIIDALIREHGVNWCWSHLCQALGRPLEEMEASLLQNSPEIQQLLRRNGKDPSNAILSLLITLIANVAEIAAGLAAVEATCKARFSLRNWAENKEGNTPLIIRHEQSRPEQSRAFARLVIAITGRALLSDKVKDEKDHRIWLFADELPRIGRVDIDDISALVRSRGGRLVVSIQSIAQLRQVGGADFADSFVENFGLRIICQLSSGEAAKTISERWIGERSVRSTLYKDKDKDPVAAPVIEPADLVGAFGLNFSAFGKPFIRAAILGTGDVPILDWPIEL